MSVSRTAHRSFSATSVAPASSVPGRKTTNSSPPWRAKTSVYYLSEFYILHLKNRVLAWTHGASQAADRGRSRPSVQRPQSGRRKLIREHRASDLALLGCRRSGHRLADIDRRVSASPQGSAGRSRPGLGARCMGLSVIDARRRFQGYGDFEPQCRITRRCRLHR